MTVFLKSNSDAFSLDDIVLNNDKAMLSNIFDILEIDKYFVNGDGIYFNKNYTELDFYKLLFSLVNLKFDLVESSSNITFFIPNNLSKYFSVIEFVEDTDRKDNEVLCISRDEYITLYGEIKGEVFGADDTFRKPRCPYCGGERLSDIYLSNPFKNDYSLLPPGNIVEVKCFNCKQNSFLEGKRVSDFYR